MARGYPGAFGRHVNALYIWLPLCVLFFLPFFDFRRPLSLLHLDLLVLLSFSVSLAFFNHAEIYKSVPLAYPPLLYLLARMLALLRRRGRAGAAPAAARARLVARDRGGVPARLPRRAQRHRRQRHRRRLRRRDRRRADHRGPPAVRLLPERQRTRRHVRARQLRGVRALPADLRLERHLGRPPSRPCGGGLLRPRRRRPHVPARQTPARPHARHRARLRVGVLPVHAVRAREQRQRHARRGAGARRAARRLIPLAPGDGRERRVRRPRRPFQVRAARPRPGARHPRPARRGRPLAWSRGGGAGARHLLPRVRRLRRARDRARPAPRLAAHDLRAHDRLPGGPRLALLGVGPVRRPEGRRGGGGGARGGARRRCSRWCRGAATSSASRRRAERC